MRRIVCGLAVALLLPVAWADDTKPKEEPKSPRERYTAILKDFNAQQQKMFAELRNTKADEQTKLFKKITELNNEFAEKFYFLSQDAPNDAAATDALFWVMTYGAQSKVFAKAIDKVKDLVAEMPLKDLVQRLRMTYGGNQALMEAVYKRAEKDEKDAQAAELLAWIAQSGRFMPIGEKAIDRLIAKYPEHKAVERVCGLLANSRTPQAADMLRRILEKTTQKSVKAAAAMGLGSALSAQADQLADKPAEADKAAAEAEKYLTMAIDLYGDNARNKKRAEGELKAVRTLRVGKTAPEVAGEDQDGKKFALADYKGKVILLDFWQEF